MANSKRKCPYCGNYNRPDDGVLIMNRLYCSIDHATAYAKDNQLKGKAVRLKDNRKEIKERKEKIKTRSEWLKEAQKAFNWYIRVRDMRKPCISSNRPLVAQSIGGGYDCGHYRSTGSASHLRFNVFNAHAQSKHDNRYLSGNVADYRINLIKRIGLERVERLECDNNPRSFDIDYLKRVKQIFNKRARLYIKRFR